MTRTRRGNLESWIASEPNPRGYYEANEVGEGVHPPTELGRRFRDLLGLANQRLAAAADRVTLMVAGLPLTAKDAPPPAAPHDRTHEAP